MTGAIEPEGALKDQSKSSLVHRPGEMVYDHISIRKWTWNWDIEGGTLVSGYGLLNKREISSLTDCRKN